MVSVVKRGRVRVIALRFAAVCTILTSFVVIPSSTASATFFGTTASPVHYVMGDPNTIYWASIESTPAHRAELWPFWHWITQVQYANRTVLSAVPDASPYNFYWYVTPMQFGADAACVSYLDINQVPPTCAKVRVRHREQQIFTQTDNRELQDVCHEIGHGLGFSHGPTDGCMGGGPETNQGVLSNHEILHINACYITSGWSC